MLFRLNPSKVVGVQGFNYEYLIEKPLDKIAKMV